ncbi:EAL domain-containing protein, partial [Halomonas sp. BBD48]|nr:EAL domain-containing protein [Halomonas sp. BBD48]
FHLGKEDPATILRTAHSACQDARHAETGVGFYSLALDAIHQRRFSLIAGFRQALEQPQQLGLAYQPRVSMSTGGCVGAEALIRWNHPRLGTISPAEFIPLVEKTPLARALTDWVIRHAVAQAAQWHRQNLGIRVSINISATNLEEKDFTARLLATLAAQNVPLSAIELELTESALVGKGRAARDELDALAKAGVRIAIDDFGTGYSGLSYLQHVPAQVVKVDRSFVAQIENEARSWTLVKSMISMAHELGYHVVAEGIETHEAYRLLQALGCDEAQGYLLAKPLPAQEFESWLSARHEGESSLGRRDVLG